MLIIPSVTVKCTESDFAQNNITNVLDDVNLLAFDWKAYTSVQIIVLALHISSEGEEVIHRATHVSHTNNASSNAHVSYQAHILECSPYKGEGRYALLNAFTLIWTIVSAESNC